MLLFSDLHLRPESESVVMGEVLPGIRAACAQHAEKFVGFLGDFYHLRYTVDVRLQNAVRDELLRWAKDGIDLWVLPGNHDQVDIAGRNAMEVFDDLPNVTVFTEPVWTREGLWVPYRAKHEDIQAALALPKPMASFPQTLFLHHGIHGAMMNNQHADEGGLPLGMFSQFQTILCGHYHKRQQVGDRLWYIGSPWQTTAGEIGQPKGYALWDRKTLSFVETQWGPRHFKIVMTSPEQTVDLSFARPCDHVQIEVRHAGIDTVSLARQFSTAGGVRPVIENAVQHSVEQRLGAAGSIEEYAGRYVTQFGAEQGLDNARLLAVFKELTTP
jgi:hypothetical protein